MANVKALEKSPNCVFFEYQLTGRKFLIPINKDVQHRIQTEPTFMQNFAKLLRSKIEARDPAFLKYETAGARGGTTALSSSSISSAPSASCDVSASHIAILTVSKPVVASQLIPIAQKQTSTKPQSINAGVQRWTFAEVEALLDITVELMKRGIHTTADRCRGKFSSLKKKFNEINDQIPEANKGKRVQWPFFSRMNQVLGLEDSSTLEHFHGVGAATSKKRSGDSTPSPTHRLSSENSQETRSRRQKGKITNSESISRLIDLEMDRAAMDKEFLAEIKASNETSSAKSNAIISAAKAIEKVSEAFLAKHRRVDEDNKVAKAFILDTLKDELLSDASSFFDISFRLPFSIELIVWIDFIIIFNLWGIVYPPIMT
uniref:Myb/SANT-like DNA-binding domain-containing protein n=1 Tax=Daphnia galeata TaxID=27404 RepID=A0A8J2RWA4_9CRUS|nr:unnamed protein product [Daphnia galeata]